MGMRRALLAVLLCACGAEPVSGTRADGAGPDGGMDGVRTEAHQEAAALDCSALHVTGTATARAAPVPGQPYCTTAYVPEWALTWDDGCNVQLGCNVEANFMPVLGGCSTTWTEDIDEGSCAVTLTLTLIVKSQ